jgi:hypothetical protein
MTRYTSDSVYRNTKIVDSKYLDILQNSIDDIDNYDIKKITITNKHNQRPDLLAYELYGNAKLWWVFAEFNQDKLIDPIIDFKSGLQIIVPTGFS